MNAVVNAVSEKAAVMIEMNWDWCSWATGTGAGAVIFAFLVPFVQLMP